MLSVQGQEAFRVQSISMIFISINDRVVKDLIKITSPGPQMMSHQNFNEVYNIILFIIIIVKYPCLTSI